MDTAIEKVNEIINTEANKKASRVTAKNSIESAIMLEEVTAKKREMDDAIRLADDRSKNAEYERDEALSIVKSKDERIFSLESDNASLSNQLSEANGKISELESAIGQKNIEVSQKMIEIAGQMAEMESKLDEANKKVLLLESINSAISTLS